MPLNRTGRFAFSPGSLAVLEQEEKPSTSRRFRAEPDIGSREEAVGAENHPGATLPLRWQAPPFNRGRISARRVAPRARTVGPGRT
jgi:hypothetical protein